MRTIRVRDELAFYLTDLDEDLLAFFMKNGEGLTSKSFLKFIKIYLNPLEGFIREENPLGVDDGDLDAKYLETDGGYIVIIRKERLNGVLLSFDYGGEYTTAEEVEYPMNYPLQKMNIKAYFVAEGDRERVVSTIESLVEGGRN